VLIALSAMLVPAAAAHAAPDSVVTFDGLPENTSVVDQFNTPGVQIQFGHPDRFLDGSGYSNVCPTASNTGAPYITSSGITGPGASLVCTSDEIGTTYLTAFHTNVERQRVSFQLKGHGLVDNAVTVKFWGIADTLIQTQDVIVANDGVTNVSLDRGPLTQDIVTVTLSAVGVPFSTLVLDNINMSLSDTPPPAKFEIGLGKASADVVEGSSVSVPVNLLRYNGSTGAVTFSVGGLPVGLTAAQFTPNPVTGSDGPALQLTAAAPMAGDRQVAVSAAGTAQSGTFLGGGKIQTVRGIPSLFVDQGVAVVGAQEHVVSGCGTGTGEIPVGVRGGYSGPVDAIISKIDGPLVLDDTFVRVNAAGDGTVGITYHYHQPNGTHGPSTLHLRFLGTNRTEVTRDVRVFEDALRIDRIRGAYHPDLVWAPETLDGSRFGRARSNTVSLEGSFPSDCSPTFQDDFGRAMTVASRTQSSVPDQPDRIVLNLAAPAVSTKVTALGPGNVQLGQSPRIEVLDYRNDPALNAVNGGNNAGAHDYTWNQFVSTFGNDDAEGCSPFECHRDPFALMYFDAIRDKLRTNPGLCFGYSVVSVLLEDDLAEPQDYQPGIFRGWQLPVADGTPIKDAVIRWQVSQRDADWQDYRQDIADDVPSFTQFRDHLTDVLRTKDEVVLAISQGSSGHAVVAYDLVNKPDGSFDILTYNPNYPYSTAEETNAALHTSQLNFSKITVKPDGTWTGGIFDAAGNNPWKGGMNTIEIYDRMPPYDADSPFGAWTEDLGAGSDTATVSSIKVGGVEALNADGTAIKGTGVTDSITPSGADRDITYKMARGRTYDFTIKGTGKGTYSSTLLGGTAGADVSGMHTAAGREDHLKLTPGQAALDLRSAGGSPATVDLVERAGAKAQRTATLQFATRKGGGDRAELAHGTIALAHDGAATSVTATLGSFGAGAPGTVTTQAFRVGSGQRVALTPVAWGDLAGGVRLTIRDRSGRVVRRGRIGLKATRRVALRGVQAKIVRRGGRVSVAVTGRVTKRGAAPLLVAAVKVVRGGRTVLSTGASLRGAKVPRGTFSLPVGLKRLPRGARVTVTVSLADEAAGYATTRRTASARG